MERSTKIMDNDELTCLAYAELLRDAERFKQRQSAEFRATQIRTPLKTNKRFLLNTIKSTITFNRCLDGGPRNERTKDIPKNLTPRKATDLNHDVEREKEFHASQKLISQTNYKKSTFKQEGISHRFNLRKRTGCIKISLKK